MLINILEHNISVVAIGKIIHGLYSLEYLQTIYLNYATLAASLCAWPHRLGHVTFYRVKGMKVQKQKRDLEISSYNNYLDFTRLISDKSSRKPIHNLRLNLRDITLKLVHTYLICLIEFLSVGSSRYVITFI